MDREEMETQIKKREEELNVFALNSMWKQICPYKEYRETKIEQLIPAVYKAINNWEYGKKGLYIFAETRFCKTRCVYLLLKKLLYTKFKDLKQSATGGHAQPIIALNPRLFSNGCMSKFADSSIYSWIEKLCKVPILFLDDIGKEKATERVLTELFNIVEERTARGLPIIITTNYDRSMLMDKWGKDPGEQI